MDCQIDIQQRPDHLHVRVSGERTLETGRLVVEAVAAACREHGISRVLIDATSWGQPLSTFDLYELVSFHYMRAFPGTVSRAAIVEAPDNFDPTKFHETVARNWGLDLREFRELDHAVGWLAEEYRRPGIA
ncbi:MAG: hypothetical protein OEO20_04275 [Gemmatimonadota bacterium]|nr:hypothetical protein [Gemmatimonadota bacterium]MDH3367829.1 hypothetical protein [Gemmatimonadota bacterium]MDH3477503.1 hypothetical protein [Gemmatimonadota bacterium]MDH3569014.1 hypothetical protein [Gemmatimonadota bacterium]MDH5549146.1 hypothetical protein [Gemmatimonadota bacterium]